MKMNIVRQVKEGGRISYDDDRPAHQGVEAVVLAIDGDGMTVQVGDRADTTYIRFSDRKWTDFLSVVD